MFRQPRTSPKPAGQGFAEVLEVLREGGAEGGNGFPPKPTGNLLCYYRNLRLGTLYSSSLSSVDRAT